MEDGGCAGVVLLENNEPLNNSEGKQGAIDRCRVCYWSSSSHNGAEPSVRILKQVWLQKHLQLCKLHILYII